MVLDIVDNKSIFRELIDKNGDSLKMNNGNSMNTTGFENQYYVKKDIQNGTTEKIITNGEMNFLLPIVKKLDWEITSEKKKIINYNVQKATTNYGNRVWTAWFASDIPVSDGPYIFSGLPGLIVSIEDKNLEYVFNLVEVKKNNGEIFDARKKAILIDLDKFLQLAKNYYDNPNREIEDKFKSGNSYFTDAKGNKFTPDFKEMNTNQQEYIRNNNNPIELNYKINYQ